LIKNFLTSGLFEFSFSSSLSSWESTSESSSKKKFSLKKFSFCFIQICIPVILPSLLKTIRRLLRTIRFIDDTLGNLSDGHIPSFWRLSRICQANIWGLFPLYSRIRRTTSGVATLGFDPPIKPGCVVPNRRYLFLK
jgi:hypothetical protein